MKFTAVLFALSLFASTAFADFNLSIVPNTRQVAQGETFDIEVWASATGADAFNGVSVNLVYDQNALEYIPMPQSFEEGPLMPSQCGETFFRSLPYPRPLEPRYGVHLESILMCGMGPLTGPGHVFTTRWRAKNVVAVTGINFADSLHWGGNDGYTTPYWDQTRFYRAGSVFLPTSTESAVITIGSGGGGGEQETQSARQSRVEGQTTTQNSWGRIKRLYR